MIKKRSGEHEKFNIEKINKVINWAIEGISGVSLSEVEINAKLNITENITTQDIHQVIIDSAANLISLEKPNYQYVASRLLNYQLRSGNFIT
jgi:ribonucleoside-diphosphate reductase alpha chain